MKKYKKGIANTKSSWYTITVIRIEALKGVIPVKEGIHPQYKPTVIKCACGAEFETGSTKEDIKVEICSHCHPFFTGKQKLVDTGGRVDKFKKRYNLTENK